MIWCATPADADPRRRLARSAAGADRIPLLTVEGFFAGNTAEDSIAPNQVGHGRPDLAEIAARLTALAAESVAV